MLLVVVISAVLSFTTANCNSIKVSLHEEKNPDILEHGYYEEPIYHPRFLPVFKDATAIGKAFQTLQNPGNRTLQDELTNILVDIVLKNFGGDETIKRVLEVVKNRETRTFQEVTMNIAAEIALTKFKGDEFMKQVAEILKDPRNETLQVNLFNLMAEVGNNKLNKTGSFNKIATALKAPGNQTVEEKLLNVVIEAAISKFGNEELIRKVLEVFKNSKNKTIQENMLNLATNVAMTKFGNNPIVKLVAEVIQNPGNLTAQERLSRAADAALTAGLSPAQVTAIKQGIGIAGQILKLGGGAIGDKLTIMGGNSVLGKLGQSISNGTLKVGDFMSDFGGGDKGVGAAIEKFGIVMKNRNVTIQEALMQAGGALNSNKDYLSQEVAASSDELLEVDDKLAVIDNESRLRLKSDYDNKSQLDEDVVKNLESVINSLAEAYEEDIDLFENESTSVETDAPEDLDSMVKIDTLPTKSASNKGFEKKSALTEKSTSKVVDGLEDTESQEINKSVNNHDKENVSTLGGSDNQARTDAKNKGTKKAIANTGLGNNNVVKSSVKTQVGVSNTGGALSSAIAAIKAAQQALESGSGALGGALGEALDTMTNSEQTGQQEGPHTNIEITTVKLNMS